MEPVGLAIGVAGLAGLLNVCLEVIDKADSYKDFGVESRSIIAQFEADKHHFRKWARDVGIENGRLDVHHQSDLDDADTLSTVRMLLSSIREIYGKMESTVSNPHPTVEAGRNSSKDVLLNGPKKSQWAEPNVSRRDRIGWSLRGKARFTAQVQQFGSLVQRLYSLVPVERLKGADGVYNRQTGEGPGTLSSTYSQAREEEYPTKSR